VLPPVFPTAPTVFDPARGPFASTRARVGNDVLTLSTPSGCVRPGVIVARLEIRSRRNNGHVVIKVRKVQFRYDGRLVKTRTRKPFAARFPVTLTPGSRHVLSAHVIIKTRPGIRRTRTLHNTFTACP